MNIMARLTCRHLLENKKRSVVTILGIVTSTALISAILMGVFSFFRFFGMITVSCDGQAHACFEELSRQQVEALREDERIDQAGICEMEETTSGVRLDSGKEDRFRVGNILHADLAYQQLMVVTDYEGTLPENHSQIAVDDNFLKENGLDLKVGDTLTFEQGYRSMTVEDGKTVYLGGNYRSKESFTPLSTESCTITAILHGNRPTKDWDIIRGMDASYMPDQEKTLVRITLAHCDHKAIKTIKEIVADYGVENYSQNTEYLLSVFAFEGSGGSYRGFFLVMIVALIIVIATSVVLIVNSIGMSLTERLRYLGMLASVGATARQKRFSVYFEGLVLGIIGIPVGLLCGYIGSKVTLDVVGRRVLAADIINGAEGMRGGIPIYCAPQVVLAIVIFSALTIFISTLIPAMKAAKVMPIDALRQTGVVKVNARKLRVNPLIRKIFGYEGELAYKNIRRNGVKGTVITVSIAVSVILFLTINYFCNVLQRVNQFELDFPFQVAASCALSEKDQLRNAISEMDDVNEVFSGGSISFLFEKPSRDPDAQLANTDIANPAFLTKDFSDLKVDSMMLVLLDDGDFEKMLSENGLEKEKYFGDTLRGVLLNGYFHEQGEKAVFNEEILGQSLHYDEPEGFPPAVQIGDFVTYNKNNRLYHLTPKGSITVFAPASVYYAKAVKVQKEEELTFELYVQTDNPEEVTNRIYGLMETEGYHNYYCVNLSKATIAMDVVTMMLKTAMYGFSILLTLIAVANMINTISTGVLLRRKEFAMYKSMGLEQGGFAKMIRLETLLYGIKALVAGVPIALFLSFLMYRMLDRKIYTFDPDLLMYLLVVFAVFAVVALSMAMSIGKIKDDNIIEALKEDVV
ncbi:MAG: FtsX-like permease family protein [Lachnospiraceae bacterium]|nr:FtsX-like permease family protein [Lachnospiraceae bacterium]